MRVLENDPAFARAHHNLAMALARIGGRMPEAIREMEKNQSSPVHAFRKPWDLSVTMNLQADTELLEYFCENEKDSQRMVGK